jgi:hypothetical protein
LTEGKSSPSVAEVVTSVSPEYQVVRITIGQSGVLGYTDDSLLR